MTSGDSSALRVLVTEDDIRMGRLLSRLFESIGWSATVAINGADAKRQRTEPWSLCTVDLALPDLMGLEIVRSIRDVSAAPIIVITGRTDLADVVEALDAGADDYLIKPFQNEELIARARALVRRTTIPSGTTRSARRFTDAELAIDFDANEVRLGDTTTRLTETERRLLQMLVDRADRVITHDEILRAVWGPGYEDGVANLHVYINGLRRKVEPDVATPRYIETHRGVGYRFNSLEGDVQYGT